MKIGNFDMEVLSPNEGLIEIENYTKGWPEKNNLPNETTEISVLPTPKYIFLQHLTIFIGLDLYPKMSYGSIQFATYMYHVLTIYLTTFLIMVNCRFIRAFCAWTSFVRFFLSSRQKNQI